MQESADAPATYLDSVAIRVSDRRHTRCSVVHSCLTYWTAAKRPKPDSSIPLPGASLMTGLCFEPLLTANKTSLLTQEFLGAGATTTRFLDTLPFAPHALEVVAPGMNTTIQDFPGRTGYWHIGVPPSGPMDSFAFRVANALVGNGEGAAALEVTLSGARLWRDLRWCGHVSF